MSTTERADGSLHIEEYSLADFTVAIQTAVQNGYVISLENTNYPQGFSGHFTVGMVKAELAKETVPASQTAPQRKAKPKAEPSAT